MRGYGPASYGDGFADVYDDWYSAVSDVEATTAAVRDLATAVPGHGRPPVVLELGIGTGRLALPLAAAGLDVRGIDASAAMVAALRAKPGGDLPVHLGDFRHVVVPVRPGEPGPPPVDVVLCAYNTLFNLADAEAQQACLAGVAAALRPGGALVVEAFVPPARHDGPTGAGDEVRVRHLATDRVVLTAAVRDPDAQTMAGQFIDIGPEGVRLRPWALHYLYPDELDEWAERVGLVLDDRRSAWGGAPWAEGDDHHVSTYRRVDDDEPVPRRRPPRR